MPKTADRTTPPVPTARAGRAVRVTAWVLGVVYLLMLAAWVPHYLSWPWWNDHDHFGTFAMAWDAGVLPYRDLPTFQFPGEYYLFWGLGRAFGWGHTAPLYAADAAALVAFGVALGIWSRLQFGRALPGVAGYGWFLCYYLDLGLPQVAQRDWHAAFLAALGLLAAEALPGRAGRVASALGLAAALSIRPQFVLLAPAFLLAVDASARPVGGSWALTARAALGWGVLVVAFFALTLAPLAVAGTLDDFARGLREVAPGSAYNQLTPATLRDRLADLFGAQRRAVALAAAVALSVVFAAPSRRRTASTWLAAFAGAWFFKPLSPIAHEYLVHTLALMTSVLASLMVESALGARDWPAAVRAAAVLAVLAAGFSTWPRFVDVARSVDVLTSGGPVEFPRRPPTCDRKDLFYAWEDYRAMILYLRRTVPADVRVANVLRWLPAVNAPVVRLPALPGESLAWFQYFKDRPELEAGYIRSLQETPRSVVVWCPIEQSSPTSIVPRRLISYIHSAYTPEARFGAIEVLRRRPEP